MQVVLNLPEMNVKQEELKILLAIKLFEEGIISLGKAATLGGYSESTFAEIMAKKGVSPICYDELDLKEELANA